VFLGIIPSYDNSETVNKVRRRAAMSAAVDYAVFSVLLFSGLGALHSQMVARIAGGVFSFALNKHWSFDAKSTGAVIIESRRFLLLYGFSYVLALGLLYTFMEWGSLSAYPAKILADIACFVVNFLVMKRYVFSGRDGFTARLRRLLSGEPN
jgi:putative flippase GtrA